MKATATLRATALIGVAVVLALITVQGTLALWTKTAASAAGTVRAADFAVTVTGANGQAQRLNTNGTPATIALAGIPALERGKPVTVPVVVTNSTNAGSGTFRIRATAGAPAVSGELAGYVDTGIGLASGGSCATTAPGSVRDIAQGAAGTFCLTLTLKNTAPASLGGKGATVSLGITAQQLAP